MGEKNIEKFKNSLSHKVNFHKLLESYNLVPECSIRINPNKIKNRLPFEPVPWSEHGYYLKDDYQFQLDPLYHAGAYFVQEASSMFISQIFRPINTRPLRVLDLCAGTGKKATHIISLLQRGSILYANETDELKVQQLSENLIKWGKSNCVVTKNNAKDFQFLKGYFDVIFVDAPNTNEARISFSDLQNWDENKVEKIAEIQKQLVNDIWECLAPNGLLIYSTKSYNRIENEEVVADVIKQKQAKTLPVPLKPDWNIVEQEEKGVFSYRFYPCNVIGEGFAMSVIHKTEGEYFKPPKRLSEPTITIIPEHSRLHYSNLIKNYESIVYEKEEGMVWAFAKDYGNTLIEIFARLHVIHAGIPLVEIRGNKLNPRPGLALANSFNDQILPKLDVDLQTAMCYFSCESIPFPGEEKGWSQILYKGISIGFIKNLGGRAISGWPVKWKVPKPEGNSEVWTLVDF